MSQSRKTVGTSVIDTSCLLRLLHLDLLHTLVLRYKIVYIPRHVWHETIQHGYSLYRLRWLLKRYSFLKKCSVGDAVRAQLLYDRKLNPDAPIHRGEAEAIIQASERQASEILIDEHDGRAIAQRHNLKVRGTLGLLRDLEKMGLIQDAEALIEQLKCETNFWISDKVLKPELKK